MTGLRTTPSQQRIPLTRGRQSIAGSFETSAFTSPLDAFTAVQTAIEGVQERAEETRLPQPVSLEAVESIRHLIAGNLLDWDGLEEAEREDGGWGG